MSTEAASLPLFRHPCSSDSLSCVSPSPEGAALERFRLDTQDDLALCDRLLHHFRSQEVSSRSFKSSFPAATDEEISQAIAAITERFKCRIAQEKKEETRLVAIRDKIQNDLTAVSSTTSSDAPRHQALTKKLKEAERQVVTAQESAGASLKVAELKKHAIALRYRHLTSAQIEALTTREERECHKEWLTFEYVKWKRGQFPALENGLSADELKKIEETLYYKEIIELFREHPMLLRNYFVFAFRNLHEACDDAVKIAMQFPTVQSQLTESFLDKRIKRLKNSGLLFQETHPSSAATPLVKKDVTLLINGHHESLLDQNKKITFRDSTVRTIAELFNEEFGKKNKKMGRFEYLAQGISLVDPQFPRVNLESESWWKELEEFETLTKDQVKARYNANLTDNQGLIVVKASRQYTNMRTDNNHSWFQIVIAREDGNYSVIPLGKYATFYAGSTLDLFFFIFGTQPASICFPDENEFYYHREHYAVPLVVNPVHLQRFFEKVRLDLIKAKQGMLYFQSQGNNCCSWVQETLDAVFLEIPLPRIFELDMLNTTGPFPVNHIISSLSSIRDTTSHSVANFCRILFCTLIGAAWRGYDPKWEPRAVTLLEIDSSPELKGLVELINTFVDTVYKMATYISLLALHILFNCPDPAIRLNRNPNWEEGRLSLPANLFNTGGELRKTVSEHMAALAQKAIVV